MGPPRPIPRREFLWSAAQVALFLELAGCTPDERPAPTTPGTPTPGGGTTAPPTAPEPRSSPTRDLFTPARLDTLGAMVDRLLPGLPGKLPKATELQVPQFFQQELERPIFHQVGPFVVRGLGFLDATSKAQQQSPFHLLPGDLQDELLGRFQRNEVKLPNYPADRFFQLTTSLALEGYFGHPAHGGNKDFGSWQALGVVWPR